MKRENLKLPLIGIFAFLLYFVQNFATELPLKGNFKFSLFINTSFNIITKKL